MTNEQPYREAVDHINGNPDLYAKTGFIKSSGLKETPEIVKTFDDLSDTTATIAGASVAFCTRLPTVT